MVKILKACLMKLNEDTYEEYFYVTYFKKLIAKNPPFSLFDNKCN